MMASTSADSLAQRKPGSPYLLPDTMKETMAVDPNSSPPADGSGDDEALYGDHDDAQSFIQPAMSPIATRLTSPKTPAVEKAAAMDRIVGGGYFDGTTTSRLPSPEQQLPAEPHEAGEGEAHQPLAHTSPPDQFPSPWSSSPKDIVVQSPAGHKPALSTVFGQPLHGRSLSGGADALKRLSRVLPSISLPSSFIPSRLPTPSFFSSSAASSNPDSKDATPKASPPSQSPPESPNIATSHHANTFPVDSQGRGPSSQHSGTGSGTGPGVTRPMSRRSRALRKSTSDDSLLYHSLSRVSSFGDDGRFTHVREQVNSRFKAIVDSFDAPSFKLPSTLRSPLRSVFPEYYPENVPSRSTSVKATSSSPLERAMESLTGDIVIMGGYRGSILRSAEPPHRQLWVPVKVGLNIRKVNMEVGLDPKDEEEMEKTIIPSGMLQNIGPVDISKRLFKKLRECENARTGKLNVYDFGYDWRLSPRLLSKKLIKFLKELPSNRGPNPKGALVIAHSLGGMIARHAVNQNPALFSGVVYAGSPQRCINILGPLRNGDAVLLNEKVLTAHVNFSLRTTFIFLPEDGFCFVDKRTNEAYPIDFYDVNEWVKYRLCPSVSDPPLPPLASKRSGPFGSILALSDTLSRGRSASEPAAARKSASPTRRNYMLKDRTLAPQMDSSAAAETPPRSASPPCCPNPQSSRGKNLAYLSRTLAEIKKFRAEMNYNPEHQASNSYPPIAVIYGKEIPTVYAARVAGRDGIPCSDAYDDLVFRSGDGVVLAREAMPPPGYEIVRGGRISTDRGHVSILGDLNAVGRALEAVIRGRRKGIGLGLDAVKSS